MTQAVRVKGLREFIRAADAASKETRKLVREELRNAAIPVRDEARRLFEPVDADSAAAYKVVVRRTGLVSVESRKRKTTGLRPDFGRLQQKRALEPAADSKHDAVNKLMEQAVDRIADRMEG